MCSRDRKERVSELSERVVQLFKPLYATSAKFIFATLIIASILYAQWLSPKLFLLHLGYTYVEASKRMRLFAETIITEVIAFYPFFSMPRIFFLSFLNLGILQLLLEFDFEILTAVFEVASYVYHFFFFVFLYTFTCGAKDNNSE